MVSPARDPSEIATVNLGGNGLGDSELLLPLHPRTHASSTCRPAMADRPRGLHRGAPARPRCRKRTCSAIFSRPNYGFNCVSLQSKSSSRGFAAGQSIGLSFEVNPHGFGRFGGCGGSAARVDVRRELQWQFGRSSGVGGDTESCRVRVSLCDSARSAVVRSTPRQRPHARRARRGRQLNAAFASLIERPAGTAPGRSLLVLTG